MYWIESTCNLSLYGGWKPYMIFSLTIFHLMRWATGLMSWSIVSMILELRWDKKVLHPLQHHWSWKMNQNQLMILLRNIHWSLILVFFFMRFFSWKESILCLFCYQIECQFAGLVYFKPHFCKWNILPFSSPLHFRLHSYLSLFFPFGW